MIVFRTYFIKTVPTTERQMTGRHVHSPEIWENTKVLNLPHISADIPYGTVAMAIAVEQLFKDGSLCNSSVFSMLGHQDGVVAFGKTIEEAALALLSYLSLSLESKCEL